MSDNLTLFNLLTFIPQNDDEKEIFKFDKFINQFDKLINQIISDLDKGVFYLGGQLKMTHNDLINLDLIERVREINRIKRIQYGDPCNYLEASSIFIHNKKLETIENMIIKFNLIMELRGKEKLNKFNCNYNI